MKKNRLLAAIICMFSFSILGLADDVPTINPTAFYFTPGHEDEGEESVDFSGSAPLVGRFTANPQYTEGWNAYYEWRITPEGESSPFLVRYEENTEYTFTTAGTFHIVLYATFSRGSERIEYTEEYWSDFGPLRVSIHESKLEMPNAFSPNGDPYNQIYKAKTYQSIVEFHAYIFNRWGQKLYEWTDPAGGWDGTFHGKPVKEGVYFVLVKAKGADGRVYNIRRDVNLLRGYREYDE